jgi:hypothetical protein
MQFHVLLAMVAALSGDAMAQDRLSEKSLSFRPQVLTLRQPTVVCGMTVIPADPSIDPGIRFTPPKDTTTFTIRAVQPELCWSE